MAEGSLSQEEIDALLKGVADGMEAPAKAAAGAAGAPIPGLQERLARALARAATVLSTLLSRKIEITAAGDVRVGGAALLGETPGGRAVVFRADLTGAATGPMAWAMDHDQAAVVADLMMGGDASKPPAEIDELYASAVREAVSQAITAMTNDLSEQIGAAVSPTPPDVKAVDLSQEAGRPLADAGEIALLPIRISLEGGATGAGAVAFGAAAARALGGTSGPARAVAAAAPAAPAAGPIAYRPVQFPTLGTGAAPAMPKNIDLLLDVPMQLTVELGRTSMFIKDILDLGTGSIIELDKLAGEPVDLLVNGKLVARGEVVVIDENFGVRVTDIISPMERIRSVQ